MTRAELLEFVAQTTDAELMYGTAAIRFLRARVVNARAEYYSKSSNADCSRHSEEMRAIAATLEDAQRNLLE